jgi:uncharacterized Fe-S cluster protein YjdI
MVMNRHIKKEYTNGIVTVTWDSSKCIHCGFCAKGLPEVFKPKESPWVQMGEVSSDKIMEQIKKCPSGALGFYFNKK